MGADETAESVGFSQILRVMFKQKSDSYTSGLTPPHLRLSPALGGEGWKRGKRVRITAVIDHLGDIVPTYAPDGIPSGSGVTPLAK